MAKLFDNLAVDDQLEMPASRACYTYLDDTRDPDRVVRVAVVTHIWFDPVDNKEYVALAYLKRDGSHGRPKEKRTITGLARCGWRKASQDWIAYLENLKGTESNVVSIFDRHIS